MRCPVDLPAYLIKDAELYAPGRKGSDAVEWILCDYPRLVGDLRQLRRQLDDFNRESANFDQRLSALHAACASILEL
jgi:hypothetical protein